MQTDLNFVPGLLCHSGTDDHAKQLKDELTKLESRMVQTEIIHQALIEDAHPTQRMAARNFLDYLLLRTQDIRELQDLLHISGLSSLASSESHVHSQLQAILRRLGKHYRDDELDDCTYQNSLCDTKQKSSSLFGAKDDSTVPYVMVTLDSSFAGDYGQIKNFVQNGMNVARINCARDDEAKWAKLIHLVRKASRQTGMKCKIYMDLAGPKIRTKLLTKGKAKGQVKIKEGQLIWLAEHANHFTKKEIVISCNEQGIIAQLKKGEKVLFDDGIVRGNVETIKKDRVGVRILRVSSPGSKIREKRGINFPESVITIPTLTKYDENCLPFICEYADLLGLSFVRNADDIATVQNRLSQLTDHPPKLIIKIESPEAVRNLPSLIFQGMKQESFGVMIARGDLAVEIGFERLSEVQEEILWICEAAHAPVIWATQVLETLNKSGMATRSEITDAAHAAVAECVMVNKGTHTIEVIETLHDILQRSGGHHAKKRFVFRPLSIAQKFLDN